MTKHETRQVIDLVEDLALKINVSTALTAARDLMYYSIEHDDLSECYDVWEEYRKTGEMDTQELRHGKYVPAIPM